MRISILRHGQTEFNLSYQVQGWCDSPLLPESIEKAKELGKHFKANNQSFDAFYTSTLNRTIETMKSIRAVIVGI